MAPSDSPMPITCQRFNRSFNKRNRQQNSHSRIEIRGSNDRCRLRASAKHIEIRNVAQARDNPRTKCDQNAGRELPAAGESFIIHRANTTGMMPIVESTWA